MGSVRLLVYRNRNLRCGFDKTPKKLRKIVVLRKSVSVSKKTQKLCFFLLKNRNCDWG